MTIQLPLAPAPDGCVLSVLASPKAAKDAISGIEEDAAGKTWLRVRVTAVPEDGKANRAIIKLLSKQWKIPASSFTVVTGDTSRQKRLHIAAPFEVISPYLK